MRSRYYYKSKNIYVNRNSSIYKIIVFSSIFPINGLKREKSLISQEDSKFVTWQTIKSCMAIGVNSVTKSLEKDELVLVLVSVTYLI